jgi:hypothetical protein
MTTLNEVKVVTADECDCHYKSEAVVHDLKGPFIRSVP